MKIDRTNYEIWLIDWLDGNLNDLQVENLKLFLADNPELKEEFYELNSVNLKPPKKSFSQKEHLKKSVTDLPGSQFEYLCIASLENDLSAGQETELQEILDQDPEKKRTYELIQKTRLTPSDTIYKHKNQLHRRTATQKIIRLTIMGLSAAATIALVIMAYLTIPQKLPDNTNSTAESIIVDTNTRQPSTKIVPEKLVAKVKADIPEQKTDKSYIIAKVNQPKINQPSYTEPVPDDSAILVNHNQETSIKKIIIHTTINILHVNPSSTLVASSLSSNIPPSYDERSSISKYIAKVFHEKILKKETSPDSPIKGYEIAEVGVNGLNKLLGWEMALHMNNNDNGELRSVYFNSRILKFNVPVNKSESLP